MCVLFLTTIVVLLYTVVSSQNSIAAYVSFKLRMKKLYKQISLSQSLPEAQTRFLQLCEVKYQEKLMNWALEAKAKTVEKIGVEETIMKQNVSFTIFIRNILHYVFC